MAMYKSHVVSGRIIEIQGDRILTQQGDTFCTYHSRYYLIPPTDLGIEVESDSIETPSFTECEEYVNEIQTRNWHLRKPWFSLQKKSANRI